MSNVLFSLAGKVGDNLCKLPIAYQYAKAYNTKVDIVLDLQSQGVLNLIKDEPWVDIAWLSEGITSYYMGGQPFNFGRDGIWGATYQHVFHLGYRNFPCGNLTVCSNNYNFNFPNLLTENCLRFNHINTNNLLLQAESSRPYADQVTIEALLKVLPNVRNKFDKFYISIYKDEESKYDSLREYNPTFIRSGPNLSEVLELAKDCITVTTYSAVACLCYIAKYPMVTIIENGAGGLQHFVPGVSYYGKDITVDYNDVLGLESAINQLQ